MPADLISDKRSPISKKVQPWTSYLILLSKLERRGLLHCNPCHKVSTGTHILRLLFTGKCQILCQSSYLIESQFCQALTLAKTPVLEVGLWLD